MPLGKAITIIEPFPTYMLLDLKHVETRSRPSNYRGPIYIHVSKKPVKEEWKSNPFYKMAERLGFHFGMVVAMADMVDCYQMTEENIALVSETEKQCGFWEPGRYAYVLENICPIEPFPARGQICTIWNLSI